MFNCRTIAAPEVSSCALHLVYILTTRAHTKDKMYMFYNKHVWAAMVVPTRLGIKHRNQRAYVSVSIFESKVKPICMDLSDTSFMILSEWLTLCITV